MNRLAPADRAKILGMLVEGNSLRAVSRMADVSINTVTKLLVNVGTACAAYLDANLVNLRCQRVQVDEIWAFCYAKQKNVTQEMAEARIAGDVWTFVSIEAQTKLVINWMVGQRDAGFATEFLQDLRNRLKTRVQLTTDGHKMYLTAVADTFDQNEVDYAQIVKIYGNDVEGQKRYSPAVCTGCKKHEIVGNPDPEHISTSYIERQNPTMRMGMRRFSRLTNGFSKKLENHRHSVALHCLHYNFARIHKTLRVTPAMEAGISDRVWSLEDIAGLAS